jgi:hypothetical protein
VFDSIPKPVKTKNFPLSMLFLFLQNLMYIKHIFCAEQQMKCQAFTTLLSRLSHKAFDDLHQEQSERLDAYCNEDSWASKEFLLAKQWLLTHPGLRLVACEYEVNDGAFFRLQGDLVVRMEDGSICVIECKRVLGIKPREMRAKRQACAIASRLHSWFQHLCHCGHVELKLHIQARILTENGLSNSIDYPKPAEKMALPVSVNPLTTSDMSKHIRLSKYLFKFCKKGAPYTISTIDNSIATILAKHELMLVGTSVWIDDGSNSVCEVLAYHKGRHALVVMGKDANELAHRLKSWLMHLTQFDKPYAPLKDYVVEDLDKSLSILCLNYNRV